MTPRLSGPALYVTLALAANAAVQQAAANAGAAAFVAGLGGSALLWLWPASMVTIVGAAAGLLALGDRVRRADLVGLALAAAAAVYLGLQAAALLGATPAAVSAAMYVVADIQLVVFPMVIWTLASDLFAPGQGRALFPLIASGAVAGTAVGNAAAAAAGLAGVDVFHLVWLGFVPLAGAALLLRRRVAGAGSARRRPETPLHRTMDTFVAVPVLRLLLGAFVLVQVGLTGVEYHFLVAARSLFAGRAPAMTAFLAAASLAVLAVTLLAQWSLSGRLLARAQTKNAFSVMPLALVAAGAVAVAAGPGGAVAAWGLGMVVWAAWDDPMRKTIQGLLPDDQRGWAGSLIDVAPFALGTLVGCAPLAVLAASGLPPFALAALVAACGAGAAVLGQRARAVYDESLLDWRLSRGRRSSVLQQLDL